MTIELLEPLGEGSPMRAFLNRNPAGGLIHLALKVVDLDAAITRVTAAGGRLVVAPVPDVAFQERRIAFVYLDRTPSVGIRPYMYMHVGIFPCSKHALAGRVLTVPFEGFTQGQG